MPSTSTSPAESGPLRIDVNDDQSLHEWATKLDSTPDQIKEAVQAVGELAGDVEMHLKGSRSTNAERTDEVAGEG